MPIDKKVAELAAKTLAERKATDVMVLNISEMTSIADWFVIASGNTNVQVTAMMDNLKKTFKENDIEIKSREGIHNARWIIMDLGDTVIHLFTKKEREFYNMERLWETEDNVTRYE